MRAFERSLGLLLTLLGLGIFAVARSFTVGFLVDPLGPRALPYLVAALFGVGGVTLALGRASASEATAGGPRTAPLPVRWAVGLGIMILYAAAIPFVGFLTSTVLGAGALARAFGGRWVSGLAFGLALGLGLYALFSLGFGLALPTGALFEGGP